MRKKLVIKGVVQGVGFRPFVYNLAKKFGVTGFVYNSGEGVICEAQGKNLEAFIKAIETEKPPLSKINSIEISLLSEFSETGFEILLSNPSSVSGAGIPCDVATCKNCKADIENTLRKDYAFTNCTNCGPRFTIVEKLPYDRAFTSMSKFKMCPNCEKEYNNPADRRFHAEPNACPVCGPKAFMDVNGKIFSDADAISEGARLLTKGALVAVKGVGGFHLACDAENFEAVMLLRKRKERYAKPFALMCLTVEDAAAICHVNKTEENALLSAAAPIVLLKNKRCFKGVADGVNTTGIMLAYSPLHLILLERFKKISGKKFLVMTSGNRKDEPVCSSNEEALLNLKGVADYFLLHDRDIVNRCDDSVVCFEEERQIFLRRSRGFVPSALDIDFSAEPVLAVGADMKNSFCLLSGNKAFMSQYIGDLDNGLNENYFFESLANYKKLLNIYPEIIVCDKHFEYNSVKLAEQMPGKKIYVQHHKAHIASVIAEHAINEPVIGVAFDGTGYGDDGSVWGAEFFYYDLNSFKRMGSLTPVKLAGGDAAVKEIFRPALGYYYGLFGKNVLKEPRVMEMFKSVPKEKLEIVLNMLKADFNSAKCSSAGRLFDAVCFAGGVMGQGEYDAHAPMVLESLFKNLTLKPFEFAVTEKDGFIFADPAPLFLDILNNRYSPSEISYKLHAGIFNMAQKVISLISAQTGCTTLAFSGGVFANRVLVKLFSGGMEGYKIFFNEKVPCGDGGIALGQAWIAQKQLQNNIEEQG